MAEAIVEEEHRSLGVSAWLFPQENLPKVRKTSPP